ncbi:MAG: glycoside hydrolase family 76 protein [Rothia sp. (in: high G+C Gram-positive bacteria)]|nr:glycoside hydrolase family 76 protein [Rothia sp. (in: high G+C Gram-positive bacteria)]
MPLLPTDHIFSARAALAHHSVVKLFGTRVLGVPGTLLGRVQHPDTRARKQRVAEWHYWWQAHFIDALVDAGFRALATAGGADGARSGLHQARACLRQARAVLRAIQARNYGSYPNSFYDDMAWLVLALERLNRLAVEVEGSGDSFVQDTATRLYRELTSACTDDLGGGAFWSKQRDFKNTPATAPIALAFARAHRYEQATELLNWLQANLFDAERGLYLDGIRITSTSPTLETKLEPALYTYNQGPVLGAYLALLDAGETAGLTVDPVDHICQVVDGTLKHFGRTFAPDTEAGAGQDGIPSPAENLQVLATQGGGDGGLFTGILVRYLAEVAAHPAAPEETRQKARTAVLDTAALFWAGRREYDPDLPMNELGIDPNEIRGQAVALFSPNVEQHIAELVKPGQPVELSTQLQAWMALEAAARLS